MPGKSKDQVVAARIAEGVKAGTAKAKPGSASAQMAKSMSLPSIKEFAGTPTSGLPKKVKKKGVTSPGRARTAKAPATGLPPIAPAATPPTPPVAPAAPVAPARPAAPTMPTMPGAARPAPRPALPTMPSASRSPMMAAPAGPAMQKASRPPIFGMKLGKKK